MLIRSSDPAVQGPARIPAGCGLVFFHGSGVEQILDPDRRRAWAARPDLPYLAVCESSWSRRGGEVLPEPWHPASLVTLWQAMGAGLSPDGRILVEIATAPADLRDLRERQELVLAAGALDLPVDPVFTGAGRDCLHGDGAEAWSQWTDFGFGTLRCVGPEPGPVGSGITCSRIPPGRLRDLEQAAETVLRL